MQQAEEDFLVLTAQEGGRRALDTLYRHYQRPLTGYAYRVCADAHMAQEAVQDAWLKAMKNLRQLEDPRAFRSWLYNLVRWRCIDLLRKAQRQGENAIALEEGTLEVADESPKEMDADMKLAINRLPPLEKQIIHLFYLDELSLLEIAAVLEIPVGTIKSRLNRARNRLKTQIDNTTTQ